LYSFIIRRRHSLWSKSMEKRKLVDKTERKFCKEELTKVLKKILASDKKISTKFRMVVKLKRKKSKMVEKRKKKRKSRKRIQVKSKKMASETHQQEKMIMEKVMGEEKIEEKKFEVSAAEISYENLIKDEIKESCTHYYMKRKDIESEALILNKKPIEIYKMSLLMIKKNVKAETMVESKLKMKKKAKCHYLISKKFRERIHRETYTMCVFIIAINSMTKKKKEYMLAIQKICVISSCYY
jgi:hypothetical protein